MLKASFVAFGTSYAGVRVKTTEFNRTKYFLPGGAMVGPES